jgi:hypothetical protein
MHLGLNAQYVQFNWAKGLCGSSDDEATAVAVDSSGNVYTTGYFEGTFDLDPGPGTYDVSSTGVAKMFVSKLDAAGNFVWGRGFSDVNINSSAGLAITADATENVYITGAFSNVVDFDPGPGTFSLSSAGSNDDIFILKLDAAGNFVWAKGMGSTAYDHGTGITLDPFSNIIVTGYYGFTVDFDPGPGTYTLSSVGAESGFVLKLNPQGNFVWAKSYTAISANAQCEPRGIATDASGNIYTTGAFYNGSVDFDPGIAVYSYSTTNFWEAFVSKLDSGGNFVWAKQFSGISSSCDGSAIKLDAVNNVYTTGSFGGTIDFDPGMGTYTVNSGASSNLTYISKLDVNGNFISVMNVTSTNPNRALSLALDANANILITGWFFGLTDFDPGPGTSNLSSLNQDIYIAAYTPSLNLIWVKQIIASGSDDRGNGITTFSGNVYSAGRFSYPINDFDPGPGTYSLQPVAYTDAYVHKMSPCTGPTISAISGSSFVCQGSVNLFSVAPLPPNNSYNWNLPLGLTGASSNNTLNLTCNSTGIVTVTAINGVCGPGLSQTLNVVVNPTPAITVNSGSICAGSLFTIMPSGAYSYSVQGGSTVVSPGASTSYSVIGSSTAGCVSNLVYSTVTVNPVPQLTLASTHTLICAGMSPTLTVGGALTYTWNPGAYTGPQITVTPTVTTTYTATGELSGCFKSATLTVSVDLCTGMIYTQSGSENINVYPNPNDGRFKILSDGKEVLSLEIFNSLGQKVHEQLVNDSSGTIDIGQEPEGLYMVRIMKNHRVIQEVRILKL